MYVYSYVCMYVHVYDMMCIDRIGYSYVCIHICMYTHMYVYTYVCIHMCIKAQIRFDTLLKNHQENPYSRCVSNTSYVLNKQI